MSSENRSVRTPAASRIWIAGLLLVGVSLAYAASPPRNQPSAGTPAGEMTGAEVAVASPGRTVNIEDLRVGDRVLAHNPELADSYRTRPEPDWSTWRHISLQMSKPDGDLVQVELLRPREWIEASGARPNGTVRLNRPELGAGGPAKVVSIDPAPAIRSGAGRVVTGTFAHSAKSVVDVRLSGSGDVIGCTSTHRFWSEDRRQFVPAGKLRAGERLLTEKGEVTDVRSVTPRKAPERVYNLEVDVEHAYYVSRAGILVHNDCLALPNAVAEGGVETYYRTMSPSDFESLSSTGQLPATSETFISPSLQTASQYNGVTAQITVEAGTTQSLMDIGVRNSGLDGGVWDSLPQVQSGWGSTNAFFKAENGTVNIGLGTGSALDTFNQNILSVKKL